MPLEIVVRLSKPKQGPFEITWTCLILDFNDMSIGTTTWSFQELRCDHDLQPLWFKWFAHHGAKPVQSLGTWHLRLRGIAHVATVTLFGGWCMLRWEGTPCISMSLIIKRSYHQTWSQVFFLMRCGTESCSMDDFVSDLAAFRLRYPFDDDASWPGFEWHRNASFDILLLKAYNYIMNSTDEVPRLCIIRSTTQLKKTCKIQQIHMKHMIPYDIAKINMRKIWGDMNISYGGQGLSQLFPCWTKKMVDLSWLRHKFGCTAWELNWALPAVCSRTWLCQIYIDRRHRFRAAYLCPRNRWMCFNYVAMKPSKPVLRKPTHSPMTILPDLVPNHPQAPFPKHLKPVAGATWSVAELHSKAGRWRGPAYRCRWSDRCWGSFVRYWTALELWKGFPLSQVFSQVS